MAKKILMALILTPMLVVAQPSSPSNLMFSLQTLNGFMTAAECLSLKATEHEKKEFLTARIMGLKWDVYSDNALSREWLSQYATAVDEDRVAVLRALNKYCPRTVKGLLARTSAEGREFGVAYEDALADLAIKVISVGVLDDLELKAIFEQDNKTSKVFEGY